MTIPKVQTSLAHKLTRYINKKYDTHINIDKVDLSYAGSIKLKDILIRDSHKDTIIYVKQLQSSLLSFNRIIEGKPELGTVYISTANVLMKTYKGNKDDELRLFINKFDEKSNAKASGFLLTSDLIHLTDSRFTLIDENRDSIPIVSYSKINGKIKDFKLAGPNIYGRIRDLSLLDQNGLVVDKMQTDFTYTRSYMHYLNLALQTKTSDIKGEIRMNYKRSDLSDFKNKVQINARFDKSKVSLEDARHFYRELGDQDVLHFSTLLKGSLNNFTAEHLKMYSDQKSRINGNLQFINSFQKDKGFELVANITHLESDYHHLKTLLPNILGKTLPTSFKDLGHFSMQGTSHITGKEIDADISILSTIGSIASNLKIKHIDAIDNATYEGNVTLTDITLGTLIHDPLVGNFSMQAAVQGKGFTLENLDTQIKGVISKHQYKGYTYSNIDIDGTIKDKLFSGNLTAKDPNLNLTFNGLADLSKDLYKFRFKSHVNYANFKKLHLLTRDSMAVLKGNIAMRMTGNTLENMQGYIRFNKASYSNQIQDYYFKDFNITSEVVDSIQTLSIHSSDIINGRIKGKFLFKELPRLAQNAIGSIYTNYKPYELTSNQYLDFRFTIYSQVVAVFFPKVQLGANTSIRGKIDADKDLFKLTFKSPEMKAYENYFQKIRLQIDNKNPLFNTQLSVHKVTNKFYDIADFDLVNITLNDTLYFRSEFKGGKQLKDRYNLAFYHTINSDNQSVVGLQKSDVTIKNTQWFLNPDKDHKNKLIYDFTNESITYQDFKIASDGQQILFYGEQQGKDYRNYNIDLDKVRLAKVTPDIENFDLKGLINGGIWIEKRNNMLIPTADIQLLDLSVNNELQGDLIGEIKGTESNREYDIDVSIEKEGKNSLEAKGQIDLKPQKPTIDLGITFDDYQIAMLNALGKGVMENIRGSIKGKARLKGTVENPDFSGELYLNDAGMYFPYINIDYALENNTKINLDNQSFIIDQATIYDSLFETKGKLSGSISHKYFKKWYLDLEVDTKNLLAINTPEEEDSLFYGTGYLDGIATFKGSTDQVNISINGTSNPGTEIIIPMSDIETIESSKLIQFKSPPSKENTAINSIEKQLIERFKGVSMDFNLDITKDATIEIVIDKSTGSSLKGNGNGSIQMEIDTKGTFNMYGDFVVDKGIYNFKYGGIINKPFDVKKGGTISFNGDPYKANLDIEAVYTVKANPKVILPEYESNRNIPVALITKITGELFDSKQEFDITIPNASLDMTSELDFVLNDQDTGNMMRQFVSLLAIGNFFNESNLNYTSAIGNEGISSAAMAISNALLDIFSDPSDKIQFGFDYVQGNTNGNNILETENQLGVSVATRLGKNEKILINGEVNVPTGSQSNANIAGNVSVELPLNKKETVRMKVFNRQNEIQYTDEEEGYTQGMGISWQVDFDNGKELLEKMGLKKKEEPKTHKKKDSVPEHNLIHFN